MKLLKYLAPPSASSFTLIAGYCTCSCAIGSRTSQFTWFTCANSNFLVLDHKTDSIAIKSNQAQSKWKFGAYILSICIVFKFTYWFSSLLSSSVLPESCLLLAFVTSMGWIYWCFLWKEKRLYTKWLPFFAWGCAEVIHWKFVSTAFLMPWFFTLDCRQTVDFSHQNILVVFISLPF